MRFDQDEQTKLSFTVAICTRGRPALLNRCLDAVSRLAYPNFQVLVVDNAPSDARTRAVASRWDARYATEPIAGLSRSRNRGARECWTDIVAYLDDDAVPDPKWLSYLSCEFTDPKVMCVTGRIIPLEEEVAAGCIVAAMRLANATAATRRAIDRRSPRWFEIANFGGLGGGSNMAFRRCAFDIWPGFDERLGRGTPLHGGEEQYACFSLIKLGYTVVYTPNAVVHHSDSPADLRTHRFKHLRASTGYFTFLFVEEPRFRLTVIRYVLEALIGASRTWTGRVPGDYFRIVPWWRRLIAYLSGPWLYLRSRFTDRRHRAPEIANLPKDAEAFEHSRRFSIHGTTPIAP